MKPVNVHFGFSSDAKPAAAGAIGNNSQMDLFSDAQNFNVVNEVKRQIRFGLSASGLSRDQVVDEFNRLAMRDRINNRTISRDTLESWCKDSDPSRLPNLPGLVILCYVLRTLGPLRAMLQPLGAQAINAEQAGVLTWATAEIERRNAAKRARHAAEAINL